MKNNFLLIAAALIWVNVIIILGLLLVGWNGSTPFPYTILQFDNNWFSTIVEGGYWVTIPLDLINSPNLLNTAWDLKYQSNIAFSPAYPLTAKALYHLTGLSSAWSLLFVSWLFAVTFWVYFWKILIEYKIPLWLITFCTLSVSLFPGSFFLVTGYSESMYLSGFLMFFYYTSKKQECFSLSRAACSALIMTTSRVALALITFIPFFCSLIDAWVTRKISLAYLRKIFAVGVIGAFGLVAFLLYGQLVFGSWKHYMVAQQLGWTTMVHADFLLLKMSWVFNSEDIKRFLVGDYQSDAFSNFIAHLYWYFAFTVPFLDLIISKNIKGFFSSPRFALYCVACVLTLFYCSAVMGVRYHSMTRYLLLVHTAYIIATALLLQTLIAAGRIKMTIFYLSVLGFSFLPSGCLFVVLFRRYLQIFWVA